MARLSELDRRHAEQQMAHVNSCIALYDRLLAVTGKKRGGPGSVQIMRRIFPAPHLFRYICPTIDDRSELTAEEICAMKAVPEALRELELSTFVRSPNLSRVPLASEYLMAALYGLPVECFYMACLDRSGRLKENVLLHRGVYDASIFSARLMREEIARVKPDCIILCHNHPGGTLLPSQDDLDTTVEAIGALEGSGIVMLDHIIVSSRGAVSLRQNGFVPSRYWTRQSETHKLLRSWLSEEDMPDRQLNRCAPSLFFSNTSEENI